MVLTAPDRIAYKGALDPVLERACESYGIQRPQGISLIPVGYEDCNVIVNTPDGDYVAKIFSKQRTPEQIARYALIMEKAVQAGVHHPHLSTTKEDSIVYRDPASALSMVLMRFIQGKTFYALDRAPDREELKAVLQQAATINRIDHKPAYLFDSWAIPNIQGMYARVGQFIDPDDRRLIEEAIAGYCAIPLAELPGCFVHGDFTKTNVLKGNDGNIYILDFSVANWYPRIQELAVIIANLLHDKSGQALAQKCDMVAQEYGKWNPLTAAEQKYLYPYALAGMAMEFMGAHQERHLHGNDTEETEYWLRLGRDGLRKELG